MKRPNYYKRSKGRYNAVRKARRHANPEKARAEATGWNRKRRVPTGAPYEAPSRCEACGNPLDKPYLDHCHLTGLFRGWLCHQCNTALGLVGDSPEGVRKLLNYVETAYSRLQDRLS